MKIMGRLTIKGFCDMDVTFPFFSFWWDWGFVLAKQVLYCLSHTSSPFCSGYFGDGLLNYLWGWPQPEILLISASQVTRIIGMSHWQLAYMGITFVHIPF
jgi:hypothetical protein